LEVTAQTPVTPSPVSTVAVLECKLAWLAYIMGGFIGERTSYSSTDADDLADGDMAVRLFQLMSLQQAWASQVPRLLFDGVFMKARGGTNT
jgi:hypothetical protein